MPRDCPHDYGCLMADCLQHSHLQRPGFEEIIMRLRYMATCGVSYLLLSSPFAQDLPLDKRPHRAVSPALRHLCCMPQAPRFPTTLLVVPP